MNENLKDMMEQEILVFTAKYSVDRLKISTYYFDRDYKRDSDGNLYLDSEKAIIRAFGKVTKVPIGPNEQYKTFEEAEEATKKYWQEYYKEVRASRTEKDKIAESRRQKRYRERRKQKERELKERQ